MSRCKLGLQVYRYAELPSSILLRQDVTSEGNYFICEVLTHHCKAEFRGEGAG